MPTTIRPAYRAFNKNYCAHQPRARRHFDLKTFAFLARYDAEAGAVRSYLRSERAQTVTIPGAQVSVNFEAGETIHTESSYKFAREEMIALLAGCGFGERQTFVDAGGRYALTLFVVT